MCIATNLTKSVLKDEVEQGCTDFSGLSYGAGIMGRKLNFFFVLSFSFQVPVFYEPFDQTVDVSTKIRKNSLNSACFNSA